MLGSFHLYPTASLLTELVQIFQGKYIVKASLQIEGVTRVTGMAAAEILEDAEDRARERVITLFGEVPNTQPQLAVVETEKTAVTPATATNIGTSDTLSELLSERIAEPVVATVIDSTESTLPHDVAISTAASEQQAAPVTEPIQIVSPKPEVAQPIPGIEKEVPFTEPVQIVSPKPEVTLPITAKHTVPTPDLTQLEEIAARPSTTINATKTRNGIFSEVIPTEPIAFDSTPEASVAPPIDREISQVTPVTIKPEPIIEAPLENFVTPRTELPLAAVAPPSNVTPFVPRNYNPPTEIGIPDTPATAATTTKRTKKTTQPKDNSDDIAKIAVEMERLQWTIEQGREYLFKTYRKKSRHSLSEDELRDFRSYLESQPTPVDDPLAIDPIAGF